MKLSGSFYLVLHRKNFPYLAARISSKTPSLAAGEVAIKLNVTVPEALFKQPQLQASVIIPEDSVTPPVLDAKVLDNVREIMEQQTGMEVSVRLVEGE